MLHAHLNTVWLYHISMPSGLNFEQEKDCWVSACVFSLLSAWHGCFFRFYFRGGALREIWLSRLNHSVRTLSLFDVFPSAASITALDEHMARQVKSGLSLAAHEQWFLPNPQSQQDWARGICWLMDSVGRSDRKWGACSLARRVRLAGLERQNEFYCVHCEGADLCHKRSSLVGINVAGSHFFHLRVVNIGVYNLKPYEAKCEGDRWEQIMVL